MLKPPTFAESDREVCLKKCYRCQSDKPLEDFNKDRSRADGLCIYCRDCSRSFTRAYYHNNRTTQRRRIADSRATRKAVAVQAVGDYLSNHPCVDCGERDIVVLDFDHVRGTKIADVGYLISTGYALDKIEAEISKCEVRCANCHRRKTASRHGGWWRTAYSGVV